QATTPLVTVDTQHDEMIHDAQLDYYAKKLATASSDRTVQIFEIAGEVHNKSAVLTGHEGPVWQVAWAHPKFGVLLASCSYDSQVILHRESPPGVWTPIHTHRFHESSVNSISWAPHELGLILACASSDGRVSILQHMEDDSWQTAFFQDSKLGCNAVSWAPHSCVGARDADGGEWMRLVTGACDNQVRVWRRRIGGGGAGPAGGGGAWVLERMSGEPVHSDWVRDVAWAPSTGLPCNMVASCSEDRTVVIWTQTDAGGPWTSVLMHAFGAPVWRVSWSVTGNVLAVSHGDHDVSLWKQSLAGQWECISSVEDGGPAPPKH
ncbi:unnamed protein product, partial [Phaeothamnion confervicola]